MGLEPINLRLTKAALYRLSYGSGLKYPDHAIFPMRRKVRVR